MVSLSLRLERLKFNRLQVVVTDVGVVLDQGVDLFSTVCVKVLAELRDIHDLGVFEVDGADNACIFNRLHLLLDVGGLLEDAALGVLELFDLLVALLNVLTDGQGEPVVVIETLVHLALELVDILEEQLLLDSAQVAESRVVRAEELVKAINMLHIVFLLKSNIYDRVWNILANAVKELGLADDHAKVWIEVHFVGLGALASEDRALQFLDSLVGLDLCP